jgi:hypothetical protein
LRRFVSERIFSPIRDVLDRVARLSCVVEDLAKAATAAAGDLSINADIEELAVFGVSVPGVDGGAAFAGLGTGEVEHI